MYAVLPETVTSTFISLFLITSYPSAANDGDTRNVTGTPEMSLVETGLYTWDRLNQRINDTINDKTAKTRLLFRRRDKKLLIRVIFVASYRLYTSNN